MSDGHYHYLVAQRDAILSSARMSPAARARAMGRKFHPTPAVPVVAEPAPPTPKKRLGLGPRATLIGRVQQVIDAFCKAFEVELDGILSYSHSRKVARPRQAVMHFLHVQMQMTSTPIGKLFDRDHTTCLHAVRVVTGLLASDDAASADFSARYHRAVRTLRAIWTAP